MVYNMLCYEKLLLNYTVNVHYFANIIKQIVFTVQGWVTEITLSSKVLDCEKSKY